MDGPGYSNDMQALPYMYTRFIPLPFRFDEEQAPCTDPPVKPVRAFRLTGEYLHRLVQENVEPVASLNLWKPFTHIIVEGLYVGLDGWLRIGMPNLTDYDGWDKRDERTSACITTYIPLLSAIASMNPHIVWLWQVPQFGMSNEVLRRMSNNPASVVASLKHLKLDQCVPLDGFAIPFPVIAMLHEIFPLWLDFSNAPFTIWCTVENELFGSPRHDGVYELTYPAKLVVMNLLILPNFGMFVIPASGYFKTNRTFTSRGDYQWTVLYNDRRLADYEQRVVSTWNCVPFKRIVMELDTSGVRFTPDQARPMVAMKLELVPLHAIKDDGTDGLVSYDSFIERDVKLSYARSKLNGVLLGDLNDDIYYKTPRSLFNQMVAHFSDDGAR